MKQHVRWQIAFAVYMMMLLTIFVLAYMELIPVQLAYLPMYDTAGHFILLGIASYLAHRALNRKMISLVLVRFPLGPLMISLFIMMEECFQSLSPYRTTSWSDMISNLSGIIFAYLLDRVIVWWKKRQINSYPLSN